MNPGKIFLLEQAVKREDPHEKLLQYISLIVHELRNPLTGINLSVELLESGIGKINDADLLLYLNIIKRSSSRLNTLINEVLRYPEEPVKEENYSIQKILDEVLSGAEDRISLNHVQVKKEYAPEDDFRASGNAGKIKLALTNIIVNAIDAMRSHAGELKLITRSMQDVYLVEIADNGCGISKENLAKIFTPFFTNKPGGLGLGLATTHEILRSNGIRVNVKSELEKGTLFQLFFNKARTG